MTTIGIILLLVFVIFFFVGVFGDPFSAMSPLCMCIGLLGFIATTLFSFVYHDEPKTFGTEEVSGYYVKTPDGRVYVQTPNANEWYDDYNTVTGLSDSTVYYERYGLNFQGDTVAVEQLFRF